MEILPLHDRIVVEVLKEKTDCLGIILPDTVREAPTMGKVVAKGPGRYVGVSFVPTIVQPDNVILFSKNAGFVQKIDGADYLILSETDVIAILK